MALAQRGCTIDITAFPVEEGDDGWSAAEALTRYLEAGLPPERVTVSSDGAAACRCSMPRAGWSRWTSAARRPWPETLKELLGVRPAAGAGAARLHRQPRAAAAAAAKGRLAAGADADLVVLDEDGAWRT